jgi:hypothetical protein
MVVVGQLWNFEASLENLMANGKRDLDSPRFAIALSKAYRRASQRERNQREDCRKPRKDACTENHCERFLKLDRR